jgi:CheY-like chemotaxis protein
MIDLLSSRHRSRHSVAAPVTETILVVDDQADMRNVISSFLQSAGYRVLSADGPEQAVRTARKTETIHLLITDIEMPGGRGDDLAQWIRIGRPEMQVLFMSGNPMQRRRLEGSNFIQKPFPSLNLFLKTVRNVLTQGQSIQSPISAAA